VKEGFIVGNVIVKELSSEQKHLIEIKYLLESYDQKKQDLIGSYSQTPNHLTPIEIELVEQHFLLGKSLKDVNLTRCDIEALHKMNKKYPHIATKSEKLEVVYKVR